MTRLSDRFPPLDTLNQHAFHNPRTEVINEDALVWLDAAAKPDKETFDVAIVDFPDPSTYALGKLYTTRFYKLLRSRLAPGGVVAVQCTSPLFARRSYWCIVRTIEAAGFSVRPYHAAVPSFGVWGFALSAAEPFEVPRHVPSGLDGGLRFLNDESLMAMFRLSSDLVAVPVEINRLDNQVLVRYHESDWRHWD